MKRHLVTGAAGFIGARVAELLLEQGDEVVGVDNLNDAYDTRLKSWRLQRLLHRRGSRFAGWISAMRKPSRLSLRPPLRNGPSTPS